MMRGSYGGLQNQMMRGSYGGLMNLADTVKAGTSEHEGMTIDGNYYNLKDGATNKNGGYMNIFGSLVLLV